MGYVADIRQFRRAVERNPDLFFEKVEAEVRERILTTNALLIEQLNGISDEELAEGLRALLKERDPRSPHYRLGNALSHALDAYIREHMPAEIEVAKQTEENSIAEAYLN